MNNGYIPPRAMFVFAHPDDIEFVAGGTAALWARGGSEVVYVVATDGNVGSHLEGMTAERLAETRRAEQRAAAEIAGAKECIFLGLHDGFLQPTLELRKELVRLIRKYRPNVLVTLDPTEFFPSEFYISHPDHRAIGTAALEAVFPAAEMPMLYPELAAEGLKAHKTNVVLVASMREANYFVDISPVMDRKLSALLSHQSQFVDGDPIEWVKEWNAATGARVGFAYAESFRQITLMEPD